MQRLLIVAGLLLLVAGLLWPWLSVLFSRLGRLPGDIHIRGEHFSLHVPLMTCLIVSMVVTLIFWLGRK